LASVAPVAGCGQLVAVLVSSIGAGAAVEVVSEPWVEGEGTTDVDPDVVVGAVMAVVPGLVVVGGVVVAPIVVVEPVACVVVVVGWVCPLSPTPWM
jgi:hypothetical protein